MSRFSWEIFILNLELRTACGVGLNLFISSFRFNCAVASLYRVVLRSRRSSLRAGLVSYVLAQRRGDQGRHRRSESEGRRRARPRDAVDAGVRAGDNIPPCSKKIASAGAAEPRPQAHQPTEVKPAVPDEECNPDSRTAQAQAKTGPREAAPPHRRRRMHPIRSCGLDAAPARK